jgi:hypothetical protein
MEKIAIKKVAILEDRRLGVYPEVISDWYEYIYREACGVYWNKDLLCFQSTVPREWAYNDWYRQIVSVARTGLSIRLNITDQTEYDPNESEFRSEIISANDDIQIWMSEQDRAQS